MCNLLNQLFKLLHNSFVSIIILMTNLDITQEFIQIFQSITATKLNPSDFQIVKIPSLTNLVYKITLQENTYIYKKYRNILDDFIDRKIQNYIIKELSNTHHYPKIYQINEKYRVEDFIQGYHLQRSELSFQILSRTIKQLAFFSINYTRAIEQIVPQTNNISNILLKKFQIYENIYQNMKIQEKQLVMKCQKYIQSILKVQLRENLLKVMPTQVILSHNDLNLSNIYINKNGTIQLLDFQFSNLNFIGYDLANFFNEYSTQYHQGFQIKSEWEIPPQLKSKLIQLYFSQLKIKAVDPYRIIDIGRMMSHLFWLFVGLKQIGDKEIQLDMVYYIKRRYEQFMKYYSQLVK